MKSGQSIDVARIYIGSALDEPFDLIFVGSGASCQKDTAIGELDTARFALGLRRLFARLRFLPPL